MPAGECPECQALAYLVEEDNPYFNQVPQSQHTQQPRQAHANTLHALHTLYGVLADLIEWDARMGGHEAPCWDRARDEHTGLADRGERRGEPNPTPV